jgi:hypothetical protein
VVGKSVFKVENNNLNSKHGLVVLQLTTVGLALGLGLEVSKYIYEWL